MANEPEARTSAPKHDLAEQLIAIVCGLVLSWTTIFLCAAPFTHELASARDFIAYWAAGQQMVHHANPYDVAAVEHLERANGFPAQYSVAMMRNPPWSLWMAWPLGFVGVGVATLLWTVLQTLCLVWTLRLIWELVGRPRDYVFGLALAFSPALLCLTMGQTTIFCGLGLALFLRYHEERPWLAGAALWLCLLKPQLFVPIGVVIILWSIDTRRIRLVAGAAVAMAASLLATCLIDPQAWAQYAGMLHETKMELDKVPCLSVVLRLLVNPQVAWVQQLLPLAASLAAAVFYLRMRKQWEWFAHGAPLMMASVILAPYSWIYDQGLLVPALMHAVYRTRLRWPLVVLTVASPAVLGLIVAQIPILSFWYLWPGPLWLAGYAVMLRYPRLEASSCASTASTATISS